jgi:hypothetical protein
MDEVDKLSLSLAQLNDPMNDILNQFVSSVNVKENIDILCEAIKMEDNIMEDIDGRLTDEFLIESDRRMQKYMLNIYDTLTENPKLMNHMDKYLNMSDRRKKFKHLVLIDQYLLREIIKLWPDWGLEDYLFDIVSVE